MEKFEQMSAFFSNFPEYIWFLTSFCVIQTDLSGNFFANFPKNFLSVHNIKRKQAVRIRDC